MKFTTILLAAFVMVIQLYPSLIKATVVGGWVGEEKVACDLKDLVPCLLPITAGIPPTPHCCGKLVEHQPCMCGYIKDYWFGTFFVSPNAHKLFNACKTPYPTC